MLLFRDETFTMKTWIVEYDFLVTASRLCLFIVNYICRQQHIFYDFVYFTDITPNGTLRRRRSRIPCEDDDGNLMDFLRTSGQDNTRERKSWGSLGI
jgi:hypothetical protein